MNAMYFSVITPEERLLRKAAHELTQSPSAAHKKMPYAEHQWLWRFFPGAEDQSRDFIFRRHDVDQIPRFYVVSQRPPISFSDAWTVQSRDYDPQLQNGQRLAFELRANPVVSHKVNGKSRRADVVMHEKNRLLGVHGFKRWSEWPDIDESKPALYELVQASCLGWLEQRAEQAGFRVLSRELHDAEHGVREEKSVRVDGYIQHRAERKDIRFSTVDFTGELEITNTLVFRKTLLNGIGHAKGFGCGLLLVKRI
jgi:CRISPR system Cascade subunit CasE